jgi:hypothetical protein
MSEGLTKGELAAARRYAQPILTLEGRAVSPEAKALVAHVLGEIVLPTLTPQQRRPSSIPAIERALEGALAGLILAAAEGDGWRRRPMSNDSFTSEPVSAGQFRKVYAALSAAGLVETAPAFFDRSGPVARGAETRLRLSKAATSAAAAFAIPVGLSQHFAKS